MRLNKFSLVRWELFWTYRISVAFILTYQSIIYNWLRCLQLYQGSYFNISNESWFPSKLESKRSKELLWIRVSLLFLTGFGSYTQNQNIHIKLSLFSLEECYNLNEKIALYRWNRLLWTWQHMEKFFSCFLKSYQPKNCCNIGKADFSLNN